MSAFTDLEQSLAELKAEAAKVKPVVEGAVADIKEAVTAAEPDVKRSVEQLAEKLVADLAKAGVADLGL